MTDSLRTRIITALLSEDDDVALMADAVIRVLEESVNECWEHWPARRCVVLGTVEVDNA